MGCLQYLQKKKTGLKILQNMTQRKIKTRLVWKFSTQKKFNHNICKSESTRQWYCSLPLTSQRSKTHIPALRVWSTDEPHPQEEVSCLLVWLPFSPYFLLLPNLAFTLQFISEYNILLHLYALRSCICAYISNALVLGGKTLILQQFLNTVEFQK